MTPNEVYKTIYQKIVNNASGDNREIASQLVIMKHFFHDSYKDGKWFKNGKLANPDSLWGDEDAAEQINN